MDRAFWERKLVGCLVVCMCTLELCIFFLQHNTRRDRLEQKCVVHIKHMHGTECRLS